MRRKLFYCLLFILLLRFAEAQQHLVDSIAKELKQSIPDSTRAMSMMRLAVDYEVVDTAKAYQSYREAITFASEKKMYYQLGRIYQNQSFLFNSSANYEQAILSFDHAIENYKKSDHPKAKQWEANAYNDKANSLKAQNKFQQAIEYYLKSIALVEQYKLPGGLVSKYTNLSTVFGDIGENEKQTEYALKAVAVAKKDGSRQDVFMAYFILANAYSMQHRDSSAKMALDSSNLYYNQADNTDNIDILFSYYLVSAQVFKSLAQPDSAFYFFSKSL